METSQNAEMRKCRRFSLDALASVSDGCVETPAATVDASRNGIALRADCLWQPGAHVSVRVRLPDERTAVARAVVARVEEDVMGLRLIAKGPAFGRLVRDGEFPISG